MHRLIICLGVLYELALLVMIQGVVDWPAWVRRSACRRGVIEAAGTTREDGCGGSWQTTGQSVIVARLIAERRRCCLMIVTRGLVWVAYAAGLKQLQEAWLLYGDGYSQAACWKLLTAALYPGAFLIVFGPWRTATFQDGITLVVTNSILCPPVVLYMLETWVGNDQDQLSLAQKARIND